jgi:hypothetical protein
MTARDGNDFYSVLNQAVDDMAANGFDSVERVAYWTQRLREAAGRVFMPTAKMEEMLREVLTATYRKMIDEGQIAQYHQGVERFTIDRLRSALRPELDRRILASASLIRLNRDEAMEKTLRRFEGWATSIPKGGSKAADKPDAKRDIKKAVKGLPFEERRVLIDQSAKLVSAVNEIIATDGGAIAAYWRHTGKRRGYDPRPAHVARAKDGNNLFLIRNSWAQKAGFVKPNKNGYTDRIEKPGEFVFCSCYYEYLYNVGDLPAEMLTQKGHTALNAVREKINAL